MKGRSVRLAEPSKADTGEPKHTANSTTTILHAPCRSLYMLLQNMLETN